MKKKILITRKLLKENEDKLKKLFDAKLNNNDEIYTPDKIIELSKDCDGILSAITDQFNKELINKLFIYLICHSTQNSITIFGKLYNFIR